LACRNAEDNAANAPHLAASQPASQQPPLQNQNTLRIAKPQPKEQLLFFIFIVSCIVKYN
jgi:hypothetical protein